MNTYQFETEQFGISETGIHLLRSRFNYETFNYKDIEEIVVERGRQVNNWLFLWMLGAIFFIGSTGYLSKVVYEYFLGDTVDTFVSNEDD